jgi:hypothetical protein
MKALRASSSTAVIDETNRIFAPLVAVAERLSTTTRQNKGIRNFFSNIILSSK